MQTSDEIEGAVEITKDGTVKPQAPKRGRGRPPGSLNKKTLLKMQQSTPVPVPPAAVESPPVAIVTPAPAPAPKPLPAPAAKPVEDSPTPRTLAQRRRG